MPDVNPKTHREFHARLDEVEPGMFRAEYCGDLNPEDPDIRAFPDSHLGTSAAAVKLWVEQMASSMGYDRVVWESLPPGT